MIFKKLNGIKRIRSKKLCFLYENFNLVDKSIINKKTNDELKISLNPYISNYILPFFKNFSSDFKYIIGLNIDKGDFYCYIESTKQLDITNPYNKLELTKDTKFSEDIFELNSKNKSIYWEPLRSRKNINLNLYKSNIIWTNLNLNIANNRHLDNNWEYLAYLLSENVEKKIILQKLKEADLPWFVLHISKIEKKIDQYKKYLLSI